MREAREAYDGCAEASAMRAWLTPKEIPDGGMDEEGKELERYILDHEPGVIGLMSDASGGAGLRAAW